MRTFARGWIRLLGWLSTKNYLVERHVNAKQDISLLRIERDQYLNQSGDIARDNIQIHEELKDARQQLEIVTSELDVAKRTNEVLAQANTFLDERYKTQIADQVARRMRYLREGGEEEPEV